MQVGSGRKGSSLLEFSLAGIPIIFLVISAVELSRGMWSYTTLAHAVRQGARVAAVRGQGCTANANSCGVTVGIIADSIAQAAVGLSPDQLNVTLTPASGAPQSCNPLRNCFSNSTPWPPAAGSDNAAGKSVTVSVQYTFHSAMAMFWPGTPGVQFGTLVFPASSTQEVVF